ncbi:MAG: YCF48-related protein [Acidobacteriota bacterium]
MKNIIRQVLLCTIVLAVPFTSLFSGDWKKVTPSPMESLYGIYFLNQSTGFTTGPYGVIYKTTDGGKEWKEIYRDSKAGDLNEIFFINSNTGFIAGKGARLLKTTDCGLSFNPITVSGTTNEIKSVYFQDEMTGWILVSEYGILKTADGGQTWNIVLPLTGIKMNKFSFWNNNHAVATGTAATDIYYTADGINWSKSKPAPFGGFSYTKYDLKDVFAADGSNIYAAGWGSLIGMQPSILIKSTDGGATWEFAVQEVSQRTYDNISGLYFKDPNNGVAAGGGSRGSIILRTSNGGKTWIPLDIPCGANLSAITGAGDNLWVCGSGGVILYSPDFGTTWQHVMKIPGASLSAIQFASDKVAYAAGSDGSFFKSTDGGNSWNAKYLRINHISPDVQDIFFLNENVGYASFNFRMIAKTTDGGNTWKAVLSDTTDVTQISYGIYFFNELMGYVVGKTGTRVDAIYKTTDGGQSWDIKTNIIMANLKDVAFGDENRGAVVAEGLKGLYTADGGKTWTASKFNGVPLGKTPHVLKISFLSPTDAVAVGNACMFKSTDGGVNWNYVATDGLIQTLTGLTFWDQSNGWAVGTNNATPYKTGIYQTSDGGTSWTFSTDTTVFDSKTSVSGAALDKSGKLWLCGPKGSIYTNNTTVGVEISKDVPSSYALMQNYPNPFNPSTVIEYTIPELSTVRLEVYDMLGRLVKRLVNGIQGAGTYKMNFNASGIPSGIYFYSLNVNGKILTRKMSVIK